MGVVLTPAITALAGDCGQMDGLLEVPPLWWHAWGGDANASSADAIAEGYFDQSQGAVVGAPTLVWANVLAPDCAAVTGRHFTCEEGAYIQTVRQPFNGSATDGHDGIRMVGWTIGNTYHVAEDAAYSTTGMTASRLYLVAYAQSLSGGAPSGREYSHDYTITVEFNYGATDDQIRLIVKRGGIVGLERLYPGGSWRRVATQKYPQMMQVGSGQINVQLDIIPTPNNDGLFVMHGPSAFGYGWEAMTPRPLRIGPIRRPDATKGISLTERWRITMADCTFGLLNIDPLRFSTARVQSGSRSVHPMQAAGAPGCQVVTNLLGTPSTTQAQATTVTSDGQDGLQYDVTASLADAGEGYGSSRPALLSDVLVRREAQWSFNPLGAALGRVLLPAVQLRMLQVWDDALRMGGTAGRLLVDNSEKWLAGTWGNYSLQLTLSNGQATQQVLRGIIGADPDGIRLERADPYRYADLPIRDFFAKMEVALGQEVQGDGLAQTTLVRELAQMGNIHPQFLTRSRGVQNAGWPVNGLYPSGFTGYVLPKGSGTLPKVRYTPERMVSSCLAELIQDSGDPQPGGWTIPHYHWFEPDGQYMWEPYWPSGSPVAYYATNDPTGYGQISSLTVYNSVTQMRSDVVLQGQDALTYELLQYHLPLPMNLRRLGWRHAWLQRSSRYVSAEYMAAIGQIAARQASLPTQVVRMLVPYWPGVRPGMVVCLGYDDATGVGGLYYVVEQDITVGMAHPGTNDGHMVCEAWMTLRNVAQATLGL